MIVDPEAAEATGAPGDPAEGVMAPDDEPPSGPPSADPRPGRFGAFLDRGARMPIEGWVSFGIVASCVAFVVAQLHPELLLSDTTPAGGDMGAHVWGPAYLRDVLLPSGRTSGWTPDWYAGFPAYQFYMVVPSLLILLLDVVLPYGIAFKLVTVSGLLTLPVAAWSFGRLTRLPFPTPPLLAVGATVFLFDRSFSIYGGNIASTLAGEFAFSMSLSLAILYLGVVGNGLRTGKHRGWAALLLALTGLCHLIPAFFAIAGTFVWLALWVLRDLARSGPSWPRIRPRLWWLLTVAPVAALLSAFWVLPFYARQRYLNDMGWVKERKFVDFLFFRDELTGGGLKDAPELTWVLALALVGAVLAIAFRHKAGMFLLIVAIVMGVAFVVAPQGRLWNTRLLPFYYLSLYLLAAVGLGQVHQLLARMRARRLAAIVVAPLVAVLQVAILIGVEVLPPSFGRDVVFDARFLPFVFVGIALLAAVALAEVFAASTAVRRRTMAATAAAALVIQVVMVAHQPWQADDRLFPWFWALLVVAVGAGIAELVADARAERRSLATSAVVVAIVLMVAIVLGPDTWNSGSRLLPWFYAALVLVAATAALELRDAFRAEVSFDSAPVRDTASGDDSASDGTSGGATLGRVDPGDRALAETVAEPPAVSTASLARLAGVGWAVVVAAGVLLALALPLNVWPGDSDTATGAFRLGPLETTDQSFVDGWAAWNYRGYEAPCAPGEFCTGNGYKPYFPEYEAIVRTMEQVGDEQGCGRAMWEYSPDLDSYGTPMALMLLPYWTDGCIGSMEGLYFEASTTTPFHFINQDQLSQQGSNAQRGLPYGPGEPTPTEFDQGIAHLQMLGVRYYLAYTPKMVDFARLNPDLTEVASSPQVCRGELCPDTVQDPPPRWVVFELTDAPLVEPLENEPVVLTGVGSGHTCESATFEEDPRGRECEGWLDPAVDWYIDESLWPVTLAESGPDEWQRIDVDEWLDTHEAPTIPVDPVEVSNIESGTHSISFDVDRPGTPVLVKASYFPNWRADGAEGPYRVTPNLMVVVPTDTHVELTFGRTAVDLVSATMSLVGLALLVLLFRRPALDLGPPVRPDGTPWRTPPEDDGPLDPDALAGERPPPPPSPPPP